MSYARDTEMYALLHDEKGLPRVDIEAKIRHLRHEHKALLQQTYQHAGQLQDFEGLLSPIRMLPCEVLYTIFSLACVSWDEQVREQTVEELHPISRPGLRRYQPPPFDDFGNPWPLSQVCVKWRRLALSQPLLWTRLYLDPGYHNSRHGRTYYSHIALLTKLHLERSGSLPNLDIILRGRVTDPNLICILAATSCRWLRLMCTEDTIRLFPRLPLLHTLFPLSTCIQVRVRPPFHAPCLRVLYLLGSGTWTPYALPDYTPEHLTHLICRDESLAYDSMLSMTELREIHVKLLKADMVLHGRINLPSVEKFTFEEHLPTRQMDYIMAHMEMPKLIDLSLNVCPDRSGTILLPTLSHPTQLQSLTLNLEAFLDDGEAPGLFQYLGRVPNVQHLHISVSILTSLLILDGLRIYGELPPTLPHLGSLAIEFSLSDDLPTILESHQMEISSLDDDSNSGHHYDTGAHYTALLNLIESRVKQGTLRRLHISCEFHDTLKHKFGTRYASLVDVVSLI